MMVDSQTLSGTDPVIVRPANVSPSGLNRVSTEADFDLKKIDSLKFLMQVLITVFMLSLCWRGLQSENTETRALYWGGITGVIGWWMPSPGGWKAAAPSEGKKL